MRILINQKEQDFTLCNNFKTRFLGLMGKKNIQDIYVFPHCNSIHTFFMRESIDVVLLKKDGTVIKTIENLKPWRMIIPQKNAKENIKYKGTTVFSVIPFLFVLPIPRHNTFPKYILNN